MDTVGITKLIVAILLSINSGLCHVVSYPGHLSGAHLGHLSGAHIGLHRLPFYHLGKVAGPAVLSSSSSVLRQIYSEPYYPAAPGYPSFPQYGEYAPYPQYPQYPEYGPNQVAQFLPENNQQVPPNASVSKLPPILEGFVQRIQNLLSHYNPENHNVAARPVATFLHTPNKPALTNLGWVPQYVFTPTFTDMKSTPAQGAASPAAGVNPSPGGTTVQPEHPPSGVAPLQPPQPSAGVVPLQPLQPSVGVATLQPFHPSVGVTTLQPFHPTLGVTHLHPLPPSFAFIPQQTIPPPTPAQPEQPIATQRPQPAAQPSTTSSPTTVSSDNKNSNVGPDNVGANGEQGPNSFGLLPNRPSFVPVTQTPPVPNNNQGNVISNNKNNNNVQTTTTSVSNPPPAHGAHLPGNVPQTTQRTPQPQDNNKQIPASIDFSHSPRPQQPPQPINNNNNKPSSYPSFSAYGVPDPLTSNQVGSQRPPTSVTSSPSVSYAIHSLSASTGLKTSSSSAQSSSSVDEYGVPDPFRLPSQGNRNHDGESLQTFGRSSQTSEIIALIRQYGLPLIGDEERGRPEKSSNTFAVTPLGSLSTPQQLGVRYNYDQPAKPFRYPAKYN